MEWTGILSVIGLPAVISGLTMFFVNRHYRKKDKSEESREKIRNDISELRKDFESFKEQQHEYHEKIEDKMDDSNETLDKEDNLTKVLSAALLVVIRDRIVQLYDHYSKKEYMPIYARDSLNKMYEQYHNLGGNGVTEGLVKKLLDLPTDPPKEEDDDA